MQTMSDSLGAYLKREREARHVSLQDMARATRISEGWICALEENRFEFFSQIEYVPGYLKLYSAHLDLDYQDILSRANQEFARLPAKQGSYRLSPFPNGNSPIKSAGKSGNGRIQGSDRIIKRAVMAVFAAVVISLFFFIPSEYKGPDTIRSEVSKQPAAIDTAPAVQTVAPAGISPSSPPATALPAITPAAPEEKTADKTVRVVANRDSKRYHLPGMKYFDQVLAHHRVFFDSEEDAVAAGYRKAPR